MLVEDLRFRRLVHQVTDESLFERLDQGGLTLYAGFDPTAASLHVGSLLQLCLLRRFQLAGHRPILLAGGATGQIGDPGGKSEERNLLTSEQLDANLEGIRPQLALFLDDPRLVDNADWIGKLSAIDFLRDVGKHVTVNQMIAKESVRSRIERPEHGISYTEFSYMLLQAYDFVHLHREFGCTLQVGGSDQWGNITLGVDLIRRLGGGEAFGLTTPLVTKPDGAKFGKTEAGTVWLDPTLTSPYRFFQYFLGSDDAAVGDYLRYFTFLSPEEIVALDAATTSQPERREAQRALAQAVTTLVHGGTASRAAESAAAALFGGDLKSLDEATLLDVFTEVPAANVDRAAIVEGRLDLLDALVTLGLAASKGEARRAIAQGGAYVNHVVSGERALGPDDLLCGRYVVLRRGKRSLGLLRAD